MKVYVVTMEDNGDLIGVYKDKEKVRNFLIKENEVSPGLLEGFDWTDGKDLGTGLLVEEAELR